MPERVKNILRKNVNDLEAKEVFIDANGVGVYLDGKKEYYNSSLLTDSTNDGSIKTVLDNLKALSLSASTKTQLLDEENVTVKGILLENNSQIEEF